MSGNRLKPIAIIPDFPRDVKVMDEKGELTPDYHLFLSQLITVLQTFFKPEGFLFPQKTTSEINSLKGQPSNRNIIYDSVKNDFFVNVLVPTSLLPAIVKQVWLQMATIEDFAGNPNGNVAGNLNQFCWDSVAKVLYICTSTGNELTAIWTAV